MAKLPNHYENLQVPRNAPDDVIRAAYKHLARRYHPDRNANSAESHRLMQALNASFEILNDPATRAEHDQWLAAHEATVLEPIRRLATRLTALHIRLAATRASLRQSLARAFVVGGRLPPHWREIFSAWIAPSGLVVSLMWGLSVTHRLAPTSPPAPQPVNTIESASTPAESAYRRPLAAPNGSAWPSRAGEIAGYPVERTDGRSEVTVDNSRNSTDVFVKLVSTDDGMFRPVRHVYIPARRTYKCQNVRAGNYEVWYQDLATGSLKRSQPFELVETRNDRAVNYSVMRIILFKMSDGLAPSQQVAGSAF